MIVIARKTGRLGNRLKLFSHFIALACEHDLSVANPSFYKYAHLFRGSARSGLASFFSGNGPSRDALLPSRFTRGLAYNLLHGALEVGSLFQLRRWLEIRDLDLSETQNISDPTFVELCKQRTVIVRGYRFRCPDLLMRHRETIRDYFRLMPSAAAEVEEKLSGLRDRQDLTVGVHIRHGDYATYRGGKYYYSIPTYRDLMCKIQHVFPGKSIRFLVCSDAKLDSFQFQGLDVTISRSSPVVDLYSLAGCNFIVGPPSTFTEWASFYGNAPLYHIHDPSVPIQRGSFALNVDWEASLLQAA